MWEIEASNRSRAREFTGENISGMTFWWGNVAPGVAEVGSLFPRVRGSIWESCQQKVHRTLARARFARQNARTGGALSTSGR